MSNYDLSDYVDVKQRLILFHQTYPTGSIQFEFKGVCEHNPDFIWGIAYAYRTPDDTRPGIGTAQELRVGRTSFTRGSELMNLESSCWGRSIGSLGLGLDKGIATRQEIELARDRNAGGSEPEPTPPAVTAPPNDPWDMPYLKTGESADIRHRDNPLVMTEKQYKYIKACFNGAIGAMTDFVNAWKHDNGVDEADKLTRTQASSLIDELKTLGYVPVSRNRKDIDPDVTAE